MDNDQSADAAILAHLTLSAFAGLVANLDRLGLLDAMAIEHARRPIETVTGEFRTEETKNYVAECLTLLPSVPKPTEKDESDPDEFQPTTASPL